MTLSKLLVRLAVAVASFVIVTTGLLISAGALAIAVDWRLPEGEALVGPSSVFDRELRPIARFVAEVERTPVPLEEISPNLQNAVIAKEDHRFFEHRGVDPISVLRAVWNNVRTGGLREGGSTLTQQYVKSVYVGSERTFSRKIREAVLSVQLEKERSKREILDDYLNRVYFGEGAYGAEAAAQTYFAKPATDLTVAEAATLASVLSAPSRYSPRNDPEGALARRNAVIDDMVRFGLLDAAAGGRARAEPLVVAPRREIPTPVPYFVEEVRRQVLDALGPELVYYGGLHIITTLDLDRQRRLEQAVRGHLPPDPAFDAGVVAVEPGTGDVVAAWGGRDFTESQVDLAFGRGGGGRPTGSSFKPMVLATALEEGNELSTGYRAPGVLQIGDQRYRGGGCGGRCTLQQAIVRSVNTVFLQLGQDVGLDDVATMAQRLGVRRAIDPAHEGASMALGTAALTPVDMASAFATFANDGVACPARVVLEVRNPSGPPLEPPDPRRPSPEQLQAWSARLNELGYPFGDEDLGRCYRAVAPSVARHMNHALGLVVQSGTGRAADIGRPQAGKTGTTNDSREVWFVGYTPDLSMAVFFGGRHDSRPLVGLPGCRGGCEGGEIPALVWRDAAAAMLATVDATPFASQITDERLGGGGGERRIGPPVEPTPSATTAAPTATPQTEPTPAEQTPSEAPQPTATPTDDGILPPLFDS